jgi:hypothetical protein
MYNFALILQNIFKTVYNFFKNFISSYMLVFHIYRVFTSNKNIQFKIRILKLKNRTKTMKFIYRNSPSYNILSSLFIKLRQTSLSSAFIELNPLQLRV